MPKFDERNPFAFLGPHVERDGYVVRALHPAATHVDIQAADGQRVSMSRSGDGLYEARLRSEPGHHSPPDYRLVIKYAGGHALDIDDPYRYGRVLSDFDLHLFAEGTHHRV
jgi:1,4-alpha-glucan branching enzyme